MPVSQPVFGPLYRMPLRETDELKRQIEEGERKCFTVPLKPPTGAPSLPVKRLMGRIGSV